MNVRIFWVREMEWMCAQTRPRLVLSSERVLGRMESEPILTSSIPSTGNVLWGGLNPRRCTKQASEPKTLPTSYSGTLTQISDPDLWGWNVGYLPSLGRLVGTVVRRPPRERQTWVPVPFSLWIFFPVRVMQEWSKNWYSSGYPARRLAL